MNKTTKTNETMRRDIRFNLIRLAAKLELSRAYSRMLTQFKTIEQTFQELIQSDTVSGD